MSHYRRANTAGASYFFTVVTYRRQRFLCDDDVRHALKHAIQKVRAKYPFTIDAWVLLPDHLHTIWTLPANDANFALRWQLIKRDVSIHCGQRLYRPEWMSASKTKHRESSLWQRRYWEHLIRDEADYARHMDYSYFNPVKHGLVADVKDWPYSTFHRDVKTGIYDESWGSGFECATGEFGDS